MRWRARTIVQRHGARRASRPQLKRDPLGCHHRSIMNERTRRAGAIATRMGIRFARLVVVPAPFALVWVLIKRPAQLGEAALVLAGATVFTFAFYFVLIFTLAAAFPPPADRLEFPGAGKVVWPLIGLLVVATAYLVWAERPR